MKKNEETQPATWEVVDPKPPVIHSGKMESRICRDQGICENKPT